MATFEIDIAIIGGGIAGLTAAIAAQNAGMRSLVLERKESLRDSAGESMHPGLAPLADQLGLLTDIESAATGRFAGILIRHGSQYEHFEPFGETDGEPWLGYHLPRYRLARLLYARACKLGSVVEFGNKVMKLDGAAAAKSVVTTASDAVRARWVLDATGPFGFSVRRDRTGYHRATPPRTVAYSYEGQECSDRQASCTPILQIEPWGWEWKAPLGNGVTARVALYGSAQANAERKPGHVGNVRYADGTWTVAEQPSHRGVFRIGDAALRFDPSSGKGVLRAMMTAMMAVHLICKIRQRSVTKFDAVSYYNRWIHRWFNHDVAVLSRSTLFNPGVAKRP
ncbi:MAG: NAD(P)/FAD-dependent oxidoreductase [Geminicoccaceae bacterium]